MASSRLPAVPAGVPVLVTTEQVYDLVLQRSVGMTRLKAALNAPGCPKPVLGTGPRSKRVWSAAAIVAYFNDIAESGKWPVAVAEEQAA